CPAPEALETAVAIRKAFAKYRDRADVLSQAETLGSNIQRFADVLQKELEKTERVSGDNI
ncbi:MAG TPA: hypothetical protein PLV03_09075, partial [Clostridiales bacterium]|nr:hypothetical protein [Clostridiales bacterium]